MEYYIYPATRVLRVLLGSRIEMRWLYSELQLAQINQTNPKFSLLRGCEVKATTLYEIICIIIGCSVACLLKEGYLNYLGPLSANLAKTRRNGHISARAYAVVWNILSSVRVKTVTTTPLRASIERIGLHKTFVCVFNIKQRNLSFALKQT